MKQTTLDDVRRLLPELDELRPLVNHFVAASAPMPGREWAGSARLDTLGSRMVDGPGVEEGVGEVAAAEAAHLVALYAVIADAVAALARGDRVSSARAFLDAAALEERRDRPGRARGYSESAYRVARDQSDQGLVALTLRRWARASRADGDLVGAGERYSAAHEKATALGADQEAAEAAVGAGNVLEEQGRWPEARVWYERALEAAEAAGAEAPERWHALLCLHIVARSEGDLPASLEWLGRAESAVPDAEGEAAAPFLENAWGQLHMAQGDHAGAQARLEAALDAARDARARVTIRLNLAEALLAQGHVLDSAEQARRAEREAIEASLLRKLPEAYRLLGRIAALEGDGDAFVLFERALEIVADQGLPALEKALTLQAYASSERRSGRPDRGDELERAAQELLAELGIQHMRQTWADVFGPERAESASADDNGEEDAES